MNDGIESSGGAVPGTPGTSEATEAAMRNARVEMLSLSLSLGQYVEAFAAGDPKVFCHERCSDAAAAMTRLHRDGGDVRLYLTVAQHAYEADDSVGIGGHEGCDAGVRERRWVRSASEAKLRRAVRSLLGVRVG